MDIDTPLKTVIRTTKAHLSKLEKMNIFSVRDLLEFFPRAIESTDIASDLQNIQLDTKNTLSGKLVDFRREKTPRGKLLGKAALVLDDNTTVEVIWFQIPYVLRNLKDESQVFLVGKVERSYGMIKILNPEVHLQKNVHVGTLRAIYSESPPITSKWLREKISGLLALVSEFPEILPSQILKKESFLEKSAAIRAMHQPKNSEQWHQARKRLGFEEIFEVQVRILQEKILREKNTINPYRIPLDAQQVKKDLSLVPFQLTTAQKKALYKILKDFEKESPMHRLLQGDVGSGKTVVAFLASLPIVRKKFQVCFLAPTEILAQQHFASAIKFFPSEFSVELLTGSVSETKKKSLKSRLKNGDIDVLIGTHAVLTEDTRFKNLAFAIVDEQHRFGVEQRSLLARNNAHMLAMTATPIPRTLALTVYGDQDISVINELPPGRKPVITRIVADPKTTALCNKFIDDQIQKERQIFWVCPLIDESDTIEAKNVKAEFDRISNEVFPNRKVAFLHGKMRPKEKDRVMRSFRNKEFDILVSTSVIEVGVDIPNATVMVIENSERFGLAQLHQFRGRIGRNDMQSYCFLVVGKPDDAQKTRLRSLEKSHNGLYLAEIDLKLRGMGELYGTRQSGLPDFKCADLNNVEMLQKARDWGQAILQEDVTLKKYPKLKKHIDQKPVYF